MISSKHNISIKDYRDIHYWLKKNFGKAERCYNKDCEKKSTVYQWAKIKDKKYVKDRNSFTQLCRSCHSKEDITQETKDKISKAHKGRKLSEAHKEKIRQFNIGRKHPNYQKTRETKDKLAKRYTFNGKTLNLREWSEITGLQKNTLWTRINSYNWTIADAMTIPYCKHLKKYHAKNN
jgi:hypothetical protein